MGKHKHHHPFETGRFGFSTIPVPVVIVVINGPTWSVERELGHGGRCAAADSEACERADDNQSHCAPQYDQHRRIMKSGVVIVIEECHCIRSPACLIEVCESFAAMSSITRGPEPARYCHFLINCHSRGGG